MKIAVLKETHSYEKRIALSPEVVAKLLKQTHHIIVESCAGTEAALTDDTFKQAGASIANDAASALESADVVFKIQAPSFEQIKLFKAKQVLICHASAMTQLDVMNALGKQGVIVFALELLPRISRAQSMDILSSQANISGYKAVLEALVYYQKALPMMSTAAGRIRPANVFIMGVGVAGLQAIATAKRLGAIVYATDVRPDTKEQVHSLGAKFVAVEDEEFMQTQTEGGYAKQMSDAYQQKQTALISEHIKEMDIVITTALIPNKKAPILLTDKHVRSMKTGSVVVDLATETGGNCSLSEKDKVVNKHNVTIIGYSNLAAHLATTTSELFANNLYHFFTLLFDTENNTLKLDSDDEIIHTTKITDGHSVVNPQVLAQLEQGGKNG